jgi:hypothetical protein
MTATDLQRSTILFRAAAWLHQRSLLRSVVFVGLFALCSVLVVIPLLWLGETHYVESAFALLGLAILTLIPVAIGVPVLHRLEARLEERKRHRAP